MGYINGKKMVNRHIFSNHKGNNMGEKTLEVLDEKGFVFIGDDGKPYWCRMYNNEETNNRSLE